MKNLTNIALNKFLESSFSEDDLERNFYYLKSLPSKEVKAKLKLKSPILFSGEEFFKSVFEFLGFSLDEQWGSNYEGQVFSEPFEIDLVMPFSVLLTGERLALNLLQRSCSISTYTKKYVDIAGPLGVKILDTRKTMPGLRWLDKYATRLGGAHNHRFGQMDSWMIKDNHKVALGGLKKAWDFFQDMRGNYQNTIVEIHSLDELKEAIDLGITHVMLDNFSPSQIEEAVKSKTSQMHYEVSGGINLETLESYCVSGVDAISVGRLTYGAPMLDLSLKVVD
ncbi:MAG: carboxylating nicotinate-nucleotide diphosphorylase [Bacteriovoracaceae bacterium]